MTAPAAAPRWEQPAAVAGIREAAAAYKGPFALVASLNGLIDGHVYARDTTRRGY